jgi:uncharacterized protein YqgC (DUF456 family)
MWQSVLKVIGLIFLDLAMVVSLILIPLGIPGNFILLGLAFAAAWIGGWQAIGWLALLVMVLMVLLAEVVEALLGSAMAKKFGASWWGVAGAFLGGIAGVILGSALLPLVGSLIGAFLGAAVGAVLLEAWHLRRVDQGALRAGWGAFLGKVLASLFKMSVGMGIVIYVVLRTH